MKNVTENSAAFKARMEEGRRLAAALGEPLVPLGEAAKKIGISKKNLRKAELLALAKVAEALKKYALEEKLYEH